MSITPDKAPESLIASDPNALFLQRTDEINELLDSGASLSGHERNCFFLNTGDGKFATASATSGFDFYDDARAVARCDWDQDGDVDLFFANRTAPRLRFLKNNSPTAKNHLNVRLIGTTSNRDAIGARVVLTSGKRNFVRGLRAGEGFLGQSSKWLHFGLGNLTKIDSVTVHWPGGKPEIFKKLETNTRVTLTQGSGKTILTLPPSREINLPEKTFEPQVPTSRAAVRLCSRLPIPPLEALTSDGRKEPIAPRENRPLFLILWASWCPACDSKFQELTKHSAQLTEAGIDTLALSVNGLGEGDDSTLQDAQDYLKKIGLTIELREAHPELLQQLQIVANKIITQNNPLPLPSGFLLDTTGQVAAFYRGPAPLDHLLTTAASLKKSDPVNNFQTALPYAGSWVGEVRRHSIPELTNDFIDAGFIEDGLSFAKKHQSAFDSELTYAEVFSNAGNHYTDLGDFQTAISLYRKALSVHKDAPRIHFNLALAYERQGNIEQALPQYQRAIELDPKITVAHLNRGAILARNPRYLQEGISSLKTAIRLNPNLAASYYHLGMALERSQQFKEALQNYHKASILAPDHYGNSMQLAHLLERMGQVDKALVIYENVSKLHPRNPQVAFQQGMACEKLKRIEAAIGHYRKSLAISKKYVPALNNLAFLLSGIQNQASAQEALQLATEAAILTNRQQAAILDTLASAQIANGNKSLALQTLQSALILAKKNQQKALSVELNRKIQSLQ